MLIHSQVPPTEHTTASKLVVNSIERNMLAHLIEEQRLADRCNFQVEGSFMDPDRERLGKLVEQATMILNAKRSLLLGRGGWEYPEC